VKEKIELKAIEPHQFDFIYDNHRYLLNSGGVGCLSGDTIIRLNRCGKGFKTTLEKAYKSWHGLNKNRKNFDHNSKTCIRSFNGNSVQLNEINDICYSGIKPVYLLTLENGLKVKATIEHKILTRAGWIELGDLKIGDNIACDNPKAIKSNKKAVRYKDEYFDGLLNHPYARKNGKKTPTRVEKHRIIYEAQENGIDLDSYLICLRSKDTEGFKKRYCFSYVNPGKYEIHHVDFNHFNNDPDNLRCMKISDHKKLHANENKFNFGQGLVYYSSLKSVKYYGLSHTYDICCAYSPHNFTANDIIVHNSGKTYGIVLRTLRLCIMHPGIFVLIGAQTYPLLRDTTLREFANVVLPLNIIDQYNKTEQHFKFKNGSEVIFRAFDDPNKLKSLNLGACGVEEMTDISEEIFKMLRTRLRQDKMPCCLYGATNPGTFGNWVYKYFIEEPITNSNVIYSISADNFYLPKPYLEDLDTMRKSNPEYYERMVMGKWGVLEGLIYNLPVKQRCNNLPLDKKYHGIIAGLDFGFTHPTAFIIIGYIEDKYYIIDEVYQHKMTSSDIIEAVRKKLTEYPIDVIYCDSARPEIIEDLKRAGIPAQDSVKDVFEGIMHVKSLIGTGDLIVNDKCFYTLREFDSYIWDSKSTVKEIPLKVNDDCMDAIRYALYTHRKKACVSIFIEGATRDTAEMDW
jgi:phage terminase large subunit